MARTTVVLDDDVLIRLREESRVRDATFRATLNDAIRDGLAVAERRRNSATPFRVEPFPIGLKPGLSYDSISQLIALGEGEDAR
jgi:hypothetical protein